MGKIKRWAARKNAEYEAGAAKPTVQVVRAGGLRTSGMLPWDDPSRGIDALGPSSWRHVNQEQFGAAQNQ